ncbi:carbohydrate ABC transporter permease [Pseudonocardia humida]|uniref:Carbohydrate ABC transporter permease n=1 Tax=Pseudonocardia humida TaxID=2800819 RepID=A0ABT1A5J5_9PSEU|nr:carbohydrate ABC transporter permease [Pseudonocardia humida]MCO1658287.1 carbohydrate ABC transporter permease [Pseudonocardia humida]
MISANRAGWTSPLVYVLALAVAGITIAPIVYVIIGGFRTTGQIANDPIGLPDPWVPANYADAAATGTFWGQAANSLIIATITTLLAVGLGAMAAFALARMRFRGRDALYSFFVLGLLFPVAVAVLPLYLLLRNLDLSGLLAVAVPQAAFAMPVTIVILRPFMRNVPGELEDAATIDGCGRLRFFWRILLPLSRPALVTVSVLAVVNSWNAYLLPLLVLGDAAEYTLPLGTAAFSSQYGSDTARILAFTALSMLPALLFFLVAERKMVGGLAGSVKG